MNDSFAPHEISLWIGEGAWRLRPLDHIRPEEVFDLDIRANWNEETPFIYTHSRILRAILSNLSPYEVNRFSEEEAALVLEHLLTPYLNAHEQATGDKISIRRIFRDPPSRFSDLPISVQDPERTFKVELYDDRLNSAALIVCLRRPEDVATLKKLFAQAAQRSPLRQDAPQQAAAAEPVHSFQQEAPQLGPSPATAPSPPPSPQPPPTALRVMLGPAHIDPMELMNAEGGDLIELGLPASEQMEALLVNPESLGAPVMLQGGQAFRYPQMDFQTPIASNVYFEFAEAPLEAAQAQNFNVAPLPENIVFVVAGGHRILRGRFAIDQNRLGLIVEGKEMGA